MKSRKKMKPWKKALIIVPVFLAACFVLWVSWIEMAERHNICRGCFHKVKPVVSAELVSQEKPLVFFELNEYPELEGIKVRLTHEDGSSEVVDAYWIKDHNVNGGFHTHRKGMALDSREPPMKPGLNRVAMYCVDFCYNSGLDELIPLNGYGFRYPNKEIELVSCMVEVMYMPNDTIAFDDPEL